jgi:hypothetical protein
LPYEIPTSDEICPATEGPPLRALRRQAQQPGKAVQAMHRRGEQTAKVNR